MLESSPQYRIFPVLNERKSNGEERTRIERGEKHRDLAGPGFHSNPSNLLTDVSGNCRSPIRETAELDLIAEERRHQSHFLCGLFFSSPLNGLWLNGGKNRSAVGSGSRRNNLLLITTGKDTIQYRSELNFLRRRTGYVA